MTRVEALAQFFRQRPNEWIDGRTLSHIAGAYAWRTRVSELRRHKAMVIENRLRHCEDGDYTISEYRYRPAGQAGLPLSA